jgi:hypothetical protein
MNTNVTVLPSPAPMPRPTSPHGSTALRLDSPIRRILEPIASLRLTVVLFVLSLLLVFYGTLAQVDYGIWTVVARYFRSFLVWIPLKVLVFHAEWLKPWLEDSWDRIAIPFPGGWLLGGVMLVNLLAAHIIHFKLTWRRAGILLIHSGLVLMMLGELITGIYAVEGNMRIFVNQSSNYLEHYHASELAILRPDDKDAKKDDVITVPGRLLRAGETIRDPRVPFEVHVLQYMKNSSILEILDGKFKNPANRGEGVALQGVERPEVSGVDASERVDTPAAYVSLKSPKGEDLGTYLLAVELYDPQTVTVDGKTYEISLRFKRTYKDYTVHLDEFHHKKFVGTEIPKDYRSKVTLNDPGHDVKLKTEIYMNHPLRYRGETFYQSGVLPGSRGTVLQVVRNPGWLLPYASCIIVGLGMLVHFGMHLGRFIDRRSRA